MRDLYGTLGVSADATQDDIKRAYRKRARESHPDAGGDESTFKEVQHAYQVLSDPERRARYDRFGDDGTTEATAGAGDPFGFGAGFGGLGDVIDAFFGGGGGPFATGGRRQRQRQQQGRDVLAPVTISLRDVVSGTEEPVEVEVASTCQDCGGGGSASGGGASACLQCAGAGTVQQVVRTAFGQLATAAECPRCGGTGSTVTDPCGTCGGEGRTVRTRTITVEVPPGIEDGDRLRVSGAGEAGRLGGRAGDLYVEVHIEPDEVFERDGRQLWCDVTVPFTQATLGAGLQVPTVDGDEVDVELPPGTQPGDVLTVRRCGLPPRGGGSRGDMLIRVDVEIPTELGQEETELVRRLAELRDEQTPARGQGLFSRLRGAFR